MDLCVCRLGESSRGGEEVVGGICLAAARTRQQGRVNKYEVVRISRDKVVTGLTARTLAR